MKTKKKIRWGQYIGGLAFMLLGACCGVLMVRTMEENSGSLFTLAALFVVMYAAMILQIAIHEAGHLVFGLLSGYRFCSYRIFSLMWLRQDKKICFRRFSLAGTGGQCLMEPPELADGEIPVVLYNLGGSLMNVIVSCVFLLLWWVLGRSSLLASVFLMAALVGFAFAAMNGIPMRMGAVDNDGYNALVLKRDKAALRAFWIQMKVSAETARGKRLREMPAEWFAVPTDEAMKNSMMATLGVFACNRLMDEQRFTEADKLMERMLTNGSGMAGLYRGLMICDRIYVELIGEARRELIADWLGKEQRKLMKSMKTYPSVIRTEYALALMADRDSAKAEKIMARFEKCARHYPYPGDIASERELLVIAAQRAYEPAPQ